jgi:hypothetical protein
MTESNDPQTVMFCYDAVTLQFSRALRLLADPGD